MATHTSQREKSATVSQSCGSACVGSPSVVKNRKKQFGYNNGKCLHGLNGRADLQCEYFIWVDEIGDAKKSTGVQERIEEIHNKAKQHLGGHCNNEDVTKIINTVTYMAEELKYLRKLIHGICVGFGVSIMVLLMYLTRK
ncbi:hypothetical protein PIB30_085727 [Stylosanthes scabra]|uniref:Zinc finger GRF-type domain-containing protein n=1 Tax=Stylosanthes scabra TaxID=79078 RepID=A0ABU6ZRP9_9FABA|nr:hypothetical protein [Stylosanthes scabra]